MIDNKNMILAIALSVAILLLFETFFKPNVAPEPGPDQPQQQQAQPAVPEGGQPVPVAPSAPSAGTPAAPSTPGAIPTAPTAQINAASRQAALAAAPRIRINAPRLHGSISLKGGAIDDLTLPDYRETIDPKSDEIVLFSPQGSLTAYFARFGWASTPGVTVPAPDTIWTADRDTLTPDNPVTLTWDNGEGLVFKRLITIDQNYMFGIEQTVENNTGQPVTLYPYGVLSRHGQPDTTGLYILHEGLLGVVDGHLEEVDYDDLDAEEPIRESTTTGGWVGITDKYWLASLIPNPSETVKTRFLHRNEGVVDVYQADYLGDAVQVPAGATGSAKNLLFAGAKEVKLLDGYSETYGIVNFDKAIDFGWFYFLTKPIFLALLWIHPIVGNLGIAILLLTVAIKLAFYPLANKSYRAMSKMKKLQPEMTKLRERYADDKMRLNQEMMALYKKEQVNPASGCLPILVQIPVFFALYKVLYVTIEMRHAPFFGWIQDLSAPDPTSVFNLFGLIPFTPPDFLMIGVWPLIMGITMFLQQKLNPQPADPIQAKIFLFMPIMFTFLLAQFPAGLVIYWAWNNTLSILQQWVIMRRMGISSRDALK